MNELESVKKELKRDILNKLNQITSKIGETDQIELLAFVNDHLGDVLLNWEPRALDSGFNIGL